MLSAVDILFCLTVSHYKQFLTATGQHASYRLEGTPGLTMEKYLRRRYPNAEQCIVMLGIVELLSMSTPSPHHSQYKGKTVAYLIRQALRIIHQGPSTITWITVPPTPRLSPAQDAIRIEFNSFLELNCRVINIPLEAHHYAPDGMHLNDQGNTTMCVALDVKPDPFLFHRKAQQHYIGFFKGSPFSNFYRSDIVTPFHTYSTAEQYFQHEKALSVGDIEVASMILSCHDPDRCLHLGRQVRMHPADISRWNARRIDVMRHIASRGYITLECPQDRRHEAHHPPEVPATPA